MKDKDLNIFYHYCSNQAFCSIVNNKTIRLSSLVLSNDKSEGRVISKVFDALADDDSEEVDGFSAHIQELESRYHALGFCLSENGDLLSQWRGYADDASGVSIGFSKKYLEMFAEHDVPAINITHGQFLKVEYCLEEQKEFLRPLYEEMKGAAYRGGIGLPSNNKQLDAFNEFGSLGKVPLATELYRVKDDGFSEEKEWRVVICLRGIDLGVYDCKHRVRDGKIVPYKDFSIEGSAIREVILGAKNVNSEQAVKSFLNSNGFLGVHVHKSKIPYC